MPQRRRGSPYLDGPSLPRLSVADDDEDQPQERQNRIGELEGTLAPTLQDGSAQSALRRE
jgi:hypothetical protein